MSNVNFSELQVVSAIDAAAQICIRLDNALSGANGFARISEAAFESSLGVFTTVQSNSAQWSIIPVPTLSSLGGVKRNTGTAGQFLSGIGSDGSLQFGIPMGSIALNPNIAFVQTNGNDDTGAVGDPSKPYATPQAAYNAGARVFCFGVGEFGNISGINADIMLIGCGVEQCFVGNISGTAGSVYGNGRENISVGGIYITTANGTNGSVGDPSISLHPTNGTNGSDAPSVIVSGVTSRSDAVVIAGDGGIGGYGGDITSGSGNDGANGGYGGNAGTLTVLDCTLSGYAVCIAGKGGDAGNGSNILDNAAPGGNGGAGGNGGSPGVVNVSRARVGGFYAAAGTGGSAGAGGAGWPPGGAGPVGNIIGAGTINTDFTKSDYDVASSETVNYRASLIAGTWNT